MRDFQISQCPDGYAVTVNGQEVTRPTTRQAAYDDIRRLVGREMPDMQEMTRENDEY